MTAHKCDFCHTEIVAPPGEVTSVISYLPCFHLICQTCKARRFNGPHPTSCLVCNHPTFPLQVFDLVVGDQDKLDCRFCADGVETRGRVEYRCTACNNALYCSACADQHREADEHELKLVQTVILPRSQCSTHNNVPAVAECMCGMRVCAMCQQAHASTGHKLRSYAEVSETAVGQLRGRLECTRQDIALVQKQLASVTRHRTEVRAMAAKARTAVASEVVELCNALMRRGNDVVTAIDIAEDAKLKMSARLETELKAAQQKLRKIDCLLDMTVRSVTAEDIVAPVAAVAFSDSAYQIINEKKQQVKRGMDVLRTPRIVYMSDLPPVLNALSTLGQLDVDGQLRTPMPTTPVTARMFTVTSAGLPTISSSTSTALPSSSTSTTSRPMSMSTPSTSTTFVASSLANGGGNLRNGLMQSMMMGPQQCLRPPMKPVSLFKANLPPPVSLPSVSVPNSPFNSSPQFMPPTSINPFMNVATSAAMQSQYLQQQAAMQRAFGGSTNRPPFGGVMPGCSSMMNPQGMLAAQQRQMMMNQQQQQKAATSSSAHSHAMAGANHTSAMAHQMFLQQQQQLFLQQQQRQKLLQESNGLSIGGGAGSSPFLGSSPPNSDIAASSPVLAAHLQRHHIYQQMLQRQKQQQQQQVTSGRDGPSPQVQIFENDEKRSNSTPLSSEMAAGDFGKSNARSSSSVSPDSSSVPTSSGNINNDSVNESSATKRPRTEADDGGESAPKRANLDLEIAPQSICNAMDSQNPADFPTNSPSVSTTNSETAANGVDEARRPSSTNSAGFSSTSSTAVNGRVANALGINNCVTPTSGAGTSPTSLAPKLLLKKKTPDGKYAADLVEFAEPQDVKPNVVVLKKRVENGVIVKSTKQRKKHNAEAKVSHATTTAASQKQQNGDTSRQDERRPNEHIDQWDDYCYVCNQGCDDTTGDLGCCDKCPRVFHNTCHIPSIREKMNDLPDNWNCSVCLRCDPLSEMSSSFGDRERLLCSKVVLACFANNLDAEPFYHAVPAGVSHYYDIIKNPICLEDIARKLSDKNHVAAYRNVESFLDDMNLLFKNCSLFNSPSAAVAISGRRLYALYRDAVRKHLPAYEKRVWVYVSLRDDDVTCGVSRHRRGGSVGQSKRGRREGSLGKASTEQPRTEQDT